jgi:tetratricopeptide (TPR) repeat protein
MSLFLLQGRVPCRYVRRMQKFIRIFLFILLSGQSAFSAPPASWSDWQEAKNFYEAGDYEAALQVFKAHPREGSSYYFNLGTLYSRLHRWGEAIAHLEKANKLHPHDPDIQFNLAFVRNELSQQLGSEKLDPASSWVEELADRVSLDEVRATLGLLGVIVLALWIQAYWKTRDLKHAIIQPSGIIGLFCFFITLGIYGIQRWADEHPPAICLNHLVIRSGPGNHFLELSQLNAGTKVRLLGPSAPEAIQGSNSPQSEVWKQIRYSAEGIGWIPASSLLTL